MEDMHSLNDSEHVRKTQPMKCWMFDRSYRSDLRLMLIIHEGDCSSSCDGRFSFANINSIWSVYLHIFLSESDCSNYSPGMSRMQEREHLISRGLVRCSELDHTIIDQTMSRWDYADTHDDIWNIQSSVYKWSDSRAYRRWLLMEMKKKCTSTSGRCERDCWMIGYIYIYSRSRLAYEFKLIITWTCQSFLVL